MNGLLILECNFVSVLSSPELQDHVDVSDDIVLILAANKCDLTAANSKESKELMAEATEYAQDIGAKLWRTSAKAAININEMFNGVAQSIYTIKTANGGMLADEDGHHIVFDDPKDRNTKKCCK